jgi:hypothetical protein
MCSSQGSFSLLKQVHNTKGSGNNKDFPDHWECEKCLFIPDKQQDYKEIIDVFPREFFEKLKSCYKNGPVRIIVVFQSNHSISLSVRS